MEILQKFYEVKEMRDEVQRFFVEQLELLAIERVMNNEDVKGIYEAKEIIDNAFIALEERYKKIETSETSSR